MIYAVKATSTGNAVIHQYTGENSQLTLIEAVILATASDGFSVMRDLVSVVRENFPTRITPELIVQASLKLERKGYLVIAREITPNTLLTFDVFGFHFETSLHEYNRLNKPYRIELSKACVTLQSEGRYESPAGIKVAI